MADIQGICFNSNLQVLVCKVHGAGIHPDADAITRHLRGKGHFCKGGILKEAVKALVGLPLKLRHALRDAHPKVEEQPILPIPHLTVHAGWNCQLCFGKELTTSKVLRDRHIAKVHQAQRNGNGSTKPLGEPCELQTLFARTGDRQYFRVSSTTATVQARAPSGSTQAPEDWPNPEHATTDRCEPELLSWTSRGHIAWVGFRGSLHLAFHGRSRRLNFSTQPILSLMYISSATLTRSGANGTDGGGRVSCVLRAPSSDSLPCRSKYDRISQCTGEHCDE